MNHWQMLARAIHETVVKNWKPWTIADRNFLMVATAGEVGELANLVKKSMRGDYYGTGTDVRALLADELADSQVYLYLLAGACGVDLDKAVEKKLHWLLETRYKEDEEAIAVRLGDYRAKELIA